MDDTNKSVKWEELFWRFRTVQEEAVLFILHTNDIM